MASYEEEYERIKVLHELPTFVSNGFLQKEILPGSLFAAVIVTLVNFIAIFAVRWFSPQTEKSSTNYIAYKITHFVSNTTIGFMGVYYYTTVIEANTEIEDIAMGFTNLIVPVICIQVGKNLWAIPAGMIMVNESIIKILHHVSVILIALASSSFTLGFSYYLPLMFGVFEISSIPLAMVETFKDNPEYIKGYPKEYTIVRLVFAIAFLYIRWYLYLPAMWEFLRLSAFAIISVAQLEGTSQFILILSGMTWVASCFLCGLQIFWGIVIVQGFIKAMRKETPVEGDTGVSGGKSKDA